MLNHLILGQIAIRPKCFWRVPERYSPRIATLAAVLRRREPPERTTDSADGAR